MKFIDQFPLKTYMEKHSQQNTSIPNTVKHQKVELPCQGRLYLRDAWKNTPRFINKGNPQLKHIENI